jgi:hypothetical protein
MVSSARSKLPKGLTSALRCFSKLLLLPRASDIIPCLPSDTYGKLHTADMKTGKRLVAWPRCAMERGVFGTEKSPNVRSLLMYDYGNNVAKRFQKSREWFNKETVRGHGDSQVNI